MCEPSLFSTSYVSPVLNFPSTESLHFSNLRGNGAHHSPLPHIYGRREVCSLPWTSPSACTSPPQSHTICGYSQPFITNSVPVTTTHNHSKASLGHSSKYYFQDANHRAYPDRETTAFISESGITASTSSSKYDFSGLDRGLQITVAYADVNSTDQAAGDGIKQSAHTNVPVQVSSSAQSSRAVFSDGMQRFLLWRL